MERTQPGTIHRLMFMCTWKSTVQMERGENLTLADKTTTMKTTIIFILQEAKLGKEPGQFFIIRSYSYLNFIVQIDAVKCFHTHVIQEVGIILTQ